MARMTQKDYEEYLEQKEAKGIIEGECIRHHKECFNNYNCRCRSKITGKCEGTKNGKFNVELANRLK